MTAGTCSPVKNILRSSGSIKTLIGNGLRETPTADQPAELREMFVGNGEERALGFQPVKGLASELAGDPATAE